MTKKFIKTVLPAMLAFALSGVYSIVDGFFVGQKIGDAGLAAINIAYPVTMLLQAVGTGIGMGGAVNYSIALGREAGDEAKRYIGNTVLLLLAASVVLMAGLSFIYRPVLSAFGASGDILGFAESYTRAMIMGAVFQVFSTGLVPLFRNFNKAIFTMFVMIAGFLTNIVLDYVFIFVLELGMAGAAWATVIGQGVTAAACIFMLCSRKYRISLKYYRLKWEKLKFIVKTGISPFGLTISPFLILIMMNKAAVVYGGDEAVAAYAVASYVTCVVQFLFQGVGDGSQPLMSLYVGEGNRRAADKICRMAYITAVSVSLLGIVFVAVMKNMIPQFFGTSEATAMVTGRILMIFSVGFIGEAIIRVTISYFYSIGRDIYSYILVYSQPAALLLLLALILPRLAGINGVWFAMPAQQSMVALAAVFLMVVTKQRKKNKGL